MHGLGRRCVWSVLLESYCLSQFVRLFFICCLRAPFTNVYVSLCSSCSLSSSLGATVCRSASCSSPGSMGTSPCTSFHSSFFFSLDLSRRLFLQMRHCLTVHAMLAHNPDNLQCDREPRCLPATRRSFLAQPLELFQLQSLRNESPAPALSDVTFFVQFNSRTTSCHGVPHKPPLFVASRSVSVSSNCCLAQLRSW